MTFRVFTSPPTTLCDARTAWSSRRQDTPAAMSQAQRKQELARKERRQHGRLMRPRSIWPSS